jgi:hypothetical protein
MRRKAAKLNLNVRHALSVKRSCSRTTSNGSSANAEEGDKTMSSFLEKWRGNAESPSQTSFERRAKRDEVLQTFRQHHEVETQPAQAASAAPPVDAREFFEQLCVCAVEDREFMVRYVRQPNGLFRATESVKIHAGGGSGKGSTRPTLVLSIDKIEGGHTACPWCGNGGHYHCDCGGVVCGGKLIGQLFTCRASCGEKWIIGSPVTEIKGTKPQQERHESKAPARRASASSGSSQPANENRLLLGAAGQNVPVKKAR